MLKYALISLFGVFISSVSQILLKKAAEKQYPNKLREYLNVPVILAYAIFFSATLLSIYAYKGIPLSMGPVLEASGYIFVTIFGVTIFKEKITPRKALALAIIIAGIVIYSLVG